MYPNYEFIEAMKRQKAEHKHLIENGIVTYCNEYGEEMSKVIIKFITCDGSNYYVVENYIGEVIELRALGDIT